MTVKANVFYIFSENYYIFYSIHLFDKFNKIRLFFFSFRFRCRYVESTTCDFDSNFRRLFAPKLTSRQSLSNHFKTSNSTEREKSQSKTITKLTLYNLIELNCVSRRETAKNILSTALFDYLRRWRQLDAEQQMSNSTSTSSLTLNSKPRNVGQ